LPNARFCDSCGMKVTASQPVSNTQATEGILGVIEDAMTWNYKYNLFFTSSRILVAKIRGPSDDLSYLFGGVVAGIVADKLLKPEEKRREKLKQLSAEEILKADRSNFMIPYSEIVRVEMKHFGRGRIMKIITNTREHKFNLNLRRDRFDEYVDLIRSIVPDKLSVS